MVPDLLKAVKQEEKSLVGFLRDLIAIPSESSQEKQVVERIKQEMEKVGFDEVKIDKMGNILGRIGKGKTIIAMDAHIDTVGVGDAQQWKHDPYKGKLENGVIYGRGAVDQKAGMAAMVYAGKMIKDHKLTGDYTLYVVGSVQEEDCDGLCWQYIVNEDKLKPDCVIITEPTNLEVRIGQRGRMEIGVTVKGKAAHGSAPERGINAVYLMNKIITEIEKLNDHLAKDQFLGKGTVTVTHISSKSPSLCAVPDECYIHLDRRLTRGETKSSALKEVKEAAKRAGVKAEVKVLQYARASYKGLTYPTECYFPTWTLPKTHALLKAGVKTFEQAFGREPIIGKWIFSTNGVSTMGRFKIPTLGFGPGDEVFSHSIDDRVPVEHLLKAAIWYALFPQNFA